MKTCTYLSLAILLFLDDTGMDQRTIDLDILKGEASPKTVHGINVKLAEAVGREPDFPEQARSSLRGVKNTDGDPVSLT